MNTTALLKGPGEYTRKQYAGRCNSLLHRPLHSPFSCIATLRVWCGFWALGFQQHQKDAMLNTLTGHWEQIFVADADHILTLEITWLSCTAAVLVTFVEIRENCTWKLKVKKLITDWQQRCGLALLLDKPAATPVCSTEKYTYIILNNTASPKTKI